MIEETLMGAAALLPLFLVVVVAVRALRKNKKPELKLIQEDPIGDTKAFEAEMKKPKKKVLKRVPKKAKRK